jgi:N-acetylglucosaminyldiphosphoundecaprenol N-acetyl-beta-D-mannosaminyltransferase
MSGMSTPTVQSTPPGPRVVLQGMALDVITATQAIDYIMRELAAGRGGWVLTPNLHILRLFSRDPSYAATVSGTSLRVADGMPLVWASRLRGTPLPERIAGSELVWSLTARAADEGRSVFFLGGNPGAGEQAAATLRARSPALKLAGTLCPPFGFERDPAYLAGLEQQLLAAAPDICYVGLNVEKGDPLIARLRPLLPRTWFMGVGISFSYVSGEVKHAPRWVRRVGLEWAFRLAQEPRRLGRRYLMEGIPFACQLLGSALLERRSRPPR